LHNERIPKMLSEHDGNRMVARELHFRLMKIKDYFEKLRLSCTKG